MKTIQTRDNPQDCLIFLHIPKTAGTTFAQILQRRYRHRTLERLNCEDAMTFDQAFEALSSTRKSEVGAVMGHINFGGHRLLSRPARYVTFVRRPVDRIISHYYHVLRDPHHYLYEKVCSSGMSLEDYAASELTCELENDQTRMIAGPGEYASDREMLEAAYRNIELHFDCVGVTERFAESLVLISHLRGWSVSYYRDVNIGANRPCRSAISAQAIAVIEERNQCDMELYRFAERRLEEQLAAHIPNWEAQTERFLQRNRHYVRLSEAASLVRRSVGAGVRLLKGSPVAQSSRQPHATMNTLL